MTNPPPVSPGRKVLLATFAEMPGGEPGHQLLDAAFARRGIVARWVPWDDEGADWDQGLVVVRATWDYHTRLAEFLAWARSVPRLLNGAEVFEWNTDKSYLTRLADAGLPVVPTVVAGPHTVASAVSAHEVAVVKPAVGAGGRGVQIVERGSVPDGDGETAWIVQPLISSVHTEGEISVFVFGGRAVSQYRKLPGAGSILVHEQFGGTTRAVPLEAEASDLALRVVGCASHLLWRPLAYARVDMMRLADGCLALSELELVEPGLYLDVSADNAGPFADLVCAWL
jgi:glutathione synthase/RimK-type ligase-like ATP-grasp enzyme